MYAANIHSTQHSLSLPRLVWYHALAQDRGRDKRRYKHSRFHLLCARFVQRISEIKVEKVLRRFKNTGKFCRETTQLSARQQNRTHGYKLRIKEPKTWASPIQIFMSPSSAPALVCRSSGPAPDNLFRKTLTENH